MSLFFKLSKLLHKKLDKTLNKINIKKCKRIACQKNVYYCYKDLVKIFGYDEKNTYDKKILKKIDPIEMCTASYIFSIESEVPLHIIDGKVDKYYVCDDTEKYLGIEGLLYLLLNSKKKELRNFQSVVVYDIFGYVYEEIINKFFRVSYNVQKHGEIWKTPLESCNEYMKQYQDNSSSDEEMDSDDDDYYSDDDDNDYGFCET